MTPVQRIRPMLCIPIGPGVHVRVLSSAPAPHTPAPRAVIAMNRRTIVHQPGRASVWTHGLGSVRVRL